MKKLHSCNDCMYSSLSYYYNPVCYSPKVCKPDYINGGVFPEHCKNTQ